MSKISRKFAGVLLLALLSPLSYAVDEAGSVKKGPDHNQPIQLKSGYPTTYVVQPEDTLLSIAEKFLVAPWQWPQVWRGNPDLASPNLIYPGDIVVVSEEGGKPVLSIKRTHGAPVVKLSPQVRTEQLEMPIPTIPISAIHQFLTRPYVVKANELDAAPYVVDAGKNRLLASPPGHKLYIRNQGKPIHNQHFYVVRPGALYKHAETGAVLGQEAIYLGEIRTIRQGDPITAEVVAAEKEIKVGDRLIPANLERPIEAFYPSSPERKVRCSIISNLNGISLIGRYDVVALDCGANVGLVPGDILAIDQRGNTIYDSQYYDKAGPDRRIQSRHDWMSGQIPYQKMERWTLPDPASKLQLPDEPVGMLMVFRTFNKVSFGLVMRSSDTISLLDRVRNPD